MLEEKLLETVKKYNMITENDKIVVAVSGGPDSMALLNALYNLREQLKIELFVAHVNHMIRAVADSETEFVKEFCKAKSIECYVKKIDVIKKAKEEKISTEEAGRNARYDFFEEIYETVNANKIAIAHNANDNAETVLMNIIRGTGITGLKGIDPIRANKFIRPLIEIERPEIEEYCNENKLDPKYDESNNENIYTRNKIRNMLIPYLKDEFNPSIVESINRLSNLASQESKYIDCLVESYYKQVVEDFRYTNQNNQNCEETSKNHPNCVDTKKNHQNCVDTKQNHQEFFEKNLKSIKRENLTHKKSASQISEIIHESKRIDEIIINLKEFNKLDYFIKTKILLLCVYNIFGTTKGIEKKHIEDIIKMCEKNVGNKYLTPNKNTKVSVNKGKITISKI